MKLAYQTPEELQSLLGERLKALRIRNGMTQAELSAKAGMSLRSVQKLEAGAGSNLETLIRFLKAAGSVEALNMIAPEPTISPLAMMKMKKKRRMRVRHPRGSL